jgi:tRNA(adenine34) deaminase
VPQTFPDSPSGNPLLPINGIAAASGTNQFPAGDLAQRQATWEAIMRLALSEAQVAARHDDVPVGAIVVGPDGTLLAAGNNMREQTGDPTAHAEILAIQAAARRLNEAEPLDQYLGKAQPKKDWRLTGRIVFGAWDPKAGACGSVWDLVRDSAALHQLEVIPNILASESEAVLKSFFQSKR